jgi:hypothetical protein
LALDAKSINARLTRLEEQIKSGSFVMHSQVAPTPVPQPVENEEEYPPMPDDNDAPPPPEDMPDTPAPMGFWTDLAAAVRKELRPPVSGFFVSTPNAPVQGVLKGDQVILYCANTFTLETVNKPPIMELVARKASVQLGRPVTAKAVDKNAKPVNNGKMEQLLNFSKAHSDIIKIKE